MSQGYSHRRKKEELDGRIKEKKKGKKAKEDSKYQEEEFVEGGQEKKGKKDFLVNARILSYETLRAFGGLKEVTKIIFMNLSWYNRFGDLSF